MSEAIATVTQSCLIDLHLHLDGSMSVAMARRIAEAGGMELDLSDDELRERLTVHEDCRDLNEYLARFDFPLSLLQTRDQLRLCTQLLQEELSQRGLMYAELRFAPQSHGVKGLTQREAVEAVLEGLGRSCFEAGIIRCCRRTSGCTSRARRIMKVSMSRCPSAPPAIPGSTRPAVSSGRGSISCPGPAGNSGCCRAAPCGITEKAAR